VPEENDSHSLGKSRATRSANYFVPNVLFHVEHQFMRRYFAFHVEQQIHSEFMRCFTWSVIIHAREPLAFSNRRPTDCRTPSAPGIVEDFGVWENL
jgi:hypothetical protein